jgi:hypothetical protein
VSIFPGNASIDEERGNRDEERRNNKEEIIKCTG